MSLLEIRHIGCNVAGIVSRLVSVTHIPFGIGGICKYCSLPDEEDPLSALSKEMSSITVVQEIGNRSYGYSTFKECFRRSFRHQGGSETTIGPTEDGKATSIKEWVFLHHLSEKVEIHGTKPVAA